MDYQVETITSPETIVKMSQAVRRVHVSEDVMIYIRDVIVRTREDTRLIYGASPRASISLLEAGKALAACRGRAYVIPDDIKYMLKHVLYHRLILKPETELEGITSEKISMDLLNDVAVPVDIQEDFADDDDGDWDDD